MLLQVDIFIFIRLRQLLLGHIYLFMCLHFSPAIVICCQNKDKLKGRAGKIGNKFGSTARLICVTLAVNEITE